MKKIYIIGLVAMLSVGLLATKIDDRLFEIAKNLDIYATMFRELNAYYVDEVNPNKVMRLSIQNMLKEFDPYTVFFPEDMIEDHMTMNTGSYNGIGATVDYFEGKHVVTMLYEESPADKMGIKIGDEIEKINGVDVINKSDDEFGRLLKGQTGTVVKLQLKRFGQTKPIEMTVTRGVIKTQVVPHYGMINTEVGYILLTDFMSPTAAKDVKDAIVDLKEKGMKKLVFDLRNNPGGLVSMAVDISNLFIQKDLLVVETRGKVKEFNKKYKSANAPLDLEIPLAVLINGKSASSSEIVSGTIQDYDRGVLIGKRSFGKGLVQITKPLVYNTQMKITTAKYYIPSGRCVQAIDYGHTLADGSHAKLPDSLRTLFKTKNGRMVYDGAGIDPDIVIASDDMADFLVALIKEKKIFDWATKYYFENINNKPEKNFALPANSFNDFSKWLDGQSFKYKSDDQKALALLLKSAKKNGDYDQMKGSLDNLEKITGQSQSRDLKKYWPEIKKQLELEILSRYYYQKAMKFASFEKDDYVQEAIKVLANTEKYKSILK